MIFRAVAGPIPGHAVRNSNNLIFEYGPSGALMISAGLTEPDLMAPFAAAHSLRASIAFLSAASLWSLVSSGSTPLTSHPFARADGPHISLYRGCLMWPLTPNGPYRAF